MTLIRLKRLVSISGIDAKTTGTTDLFTVPTNRKCVITKIVFTSTSANTVSVAPTLGVGVAAGEDDIMASTTLTGFTSVNKAWVFNAGSLSVLNQSNDVIKLGIDTGSTATEHTIRVDLFGYVI